MRNIIIAGPSRAGKTTLATRINKELGHFVIGLDKLVATFQGAYPQLNIRLNWDRQKTTDNLAPFLNFDKILPILRTYGIEDLRGGFTLIGLV